MTRWLPWVLLLASLGVNIGFFGATALRRLGDEEASPSSSVAESPPVASAPETSGELPTPAAGLRLARLADRLALAGPEREGFIELQRGFILEVASARRELERLQRELQQEALSADPRAERTERLLDELGDAYARVDGAFVRNVQRSREFLDQSQERQFLEMLTRLRARSRGAGGRR